ncbi:protein kinase domain-containing protein [Rubripirellula reticaptiva]|uniref:Serine/threonine-protein kinase Pkn1 n=1 Tax=Rubripirellula reticaptiva TaxID=2528013 RepID=A0A5C6FEA9_9BACT|nr:serine/threonine-protein kinase [Rubripirellula reticaptiva]TWU57911.1 Serine/threonine-protein kinase Pkn1 [Rubripirellula reticaptiva]
MTHSPDEEEELFFQASQIPVAADRIKYLDVACGGNESLKASVLELLRTEATIDDFMETPVFDVGVMEPANDHSLPNQIGPYQIGETIGRGGFGIVVRGMQTEPYVREVAIKILRSELGGTQVVTRFHSERQTLANLSHTGIAAMYDAGETVQGRPYFVMELVDGIPIDQHFQSVTMTVERFVELIVSVCEAVAHAHLKGIVHRDIKPSNVLVTRGTHQSNTPSQPTVKVIDFGIAKIIDDNIPNLAQTHHGQMLGTPGYMSPEQLTHPKDIDTRADVYGIGALMFRLVAGVSPIEAMGQPIHTIHDAYRLLQQVDPPRPRSCADEKHGAVFPVEIDWIIAKAMERDRERRYASVLEIASDLQKLLHGAAVQAGPPSRLYVARKWIARNWLLTASTLAILLAVSIGGITAAIGLSQAKHALAAEANALERAVTQRDKALAVSDLVARMIGATDIATGHPADYPLRQWLFDFHGEIDGKLDAQPDVEASVRRILGRSFYSCGETRLAFENQSRALALFESQDEPNSVNIASIKVDLALTKFARADFAGAIDEASDALKEPSLPINDQVWAHHVLSRVAYEYGDFQKMYHESKVAHETAVQSSSDSLALMMQLNLSQSLMGGGRIRQANDLSADAMEQFSQMDQPSATDIAFAKRVRGTVLRRMGNYDEAKQLVLEALETDTEVIGPSDRLVSDYVLLSQIERRNAGREASITFAQQAVDIADSLDANRGTASAMAYENMAQLLESVDTGQAITAWTKAIDCKRGLVGSRPELARFLLRLGKLQSRSGHYSMAIDTLDEAFTIVLNSSVREILQDAPKRMDSDQVDTTLVSIGYELIRALIVTDSLDRASVVRESIIARTLSIPSPNANLLLSMVESEWQLQQDNHEGASEHLSTAIRLLAESAGGRSSHMEVTLLGARIALKRSDFSEVEAKLALANKVARNRHSTMQSYRWLIIDHYIHLYELSDQPDKLSQWTAQKLRVELAD